MTLTKCENGHYFNIDKFQTCPVCGAKVMQGLNKPEKKTNSKWFPSKKEKPEPAAPQTPVSQPEPPKSAASQTPDPQGATSQSAAPASSPVNQNMPVMPDELTMIEDITLNEIPVDDDKTVGYFEIKKETPAAPAPKPVSQSIEEPKAKVESNLSEEIRQLQAESEGRTVGYFSTVHTPAESTVSVAAPLPAAQSAVPAEPMVGWLVAVKGVNRGRAYNIYSGRNSIGRNSTNRIQISGDQCISREKHAWIIYDPKHRDFSIKEGESSGLTYIDDTRVSAEIELKPYSIIEMGDSQFLFVPLCNEKFSWELYE